MLTVLGLAAVLSAASGCALEFDPGSDRAAVVVDNGLNYNGLGDNGLNYNGLNYNGLNYNGLNYNGLGYNGLGYNGLNYNGLNYNGLVGNEVWQEWMTSPDFTQQAVVFDYLVQCALDPAQTIAAIEIGGATYGPWQGVLGVAPAWFDADNDVQTTAEQERVSGCLMAHVNAVGWAVPISVISDAIAPPSAQERAEFHAFEGEFFGNLFNDQPHKSACRAGGEADAATDNELINLERMCAVDPELCGFVPSANCSDVCTGWDATLGVYAECGGYQSVGVYVSP